MTPPDWVQAMAARCAAATPFTAERVTWVREIGIPMAKERGDMGARLAFRHMLDAIAQLEATRSDVPGLLALVEDMVSALTRITGVDLGPIDGHTADDCEVRCAYHGAAAALARYTQGPGATTGGGT